MKNDELLKAIGNIDDKYIVEADTRLQRNIPVVIKYLSLAAAVVLVAAAGWFMKDNLFLSKSANTAMSSDQKAIMEEAATDEMVLTVQETIPATAAGIEENAVITEQPEAMAETKAEETKAEETRAEETRADEGISNNGALGMAPAPGSVMLTSSGDLFSGTAWVCEFMTDEAVCMEVSGPMDENAIVVVFGSDSVQLVSQETRGKETALKKDYMPSGDTAYLVDETFNMDTTGASANGMPENGMKEHEAAGNEVLENETEIMEELEVEEEDAAETEADASCGYFIMDETGLRYYPDASKDSYYHFRETTIQEAEEYGKQIMKNKDFSFGN